MYSICYHYLHSVGKFYNVNFVFIVLNIITFSFFLGLPVRPIGSNEQIEEEGEREGEVNVDWVCCLLLISVYSVYKLGKFYVLSY